MVLGGGMRVGLSFPALNELTIMNTWFEKKNVHMAI